MAATLVAFGCALFGSCTKQAPLSLEELRLRYRQTLVPTHTDTTDAVIRARIVATDQAVEQFWASMNRATDRTYLWKDSRDRFAEAQSLTMDFSRLGAMASAYYMAGSRYQGNDSLKRDAIAGLDWMYENRYNPRIPLYHNWWEWVIGVPIGLSNTIVLLYDDLTPEQRNNYLSAMDYYAPNVTFEGASTGANKVWQCSNMALRGIIANRPDQVQMAIEGLDTEFKYVTSKDGFYRDGSFVQHQWHSYNGGYGNALLSHISFIIPLVQGSEWEVDSAKQTMLFEWIHSGYEPLLYRGAMMDMVRGREVSRKEAPDRSSGHSILLSMYKLSKIAEPAEKARLQSVVKGHILADTSVDFLNNVPTYLIPEIRLLLNDPAIEAAPARSQNKIFSSMDRAVHLRPGFALGLSMSSARIENYETINGENLKAWYSGDGMTYLYTNDLKQFSSDFWPTVNAYRMPGTTVDTHARKAETLPFAPGLLYADGYKSPEHWVGGSSIEDEYGMAGMALKAFESTLTAHKSWFMCGDQIVALGAGINSSDNRTIETIVDNRKMNPEESYRLTLDGQEVLSAAGEINAPSTRWAHFESKGDQTRIGYVFPETAAVHLLNDPRTGSWREISQPYGDPTPIQRNYFTLWFDHGKNPQEATYAYILLPGLTTEETAKYAEKSPLKILSNTAQIQAVQDKTNRVIGANFWEAGKLGDQLTVSAPASILVHETDQSWVIGLSDPTQLHSGKITLELPSVSASGVEQVSETITVLSTTPSVRLEVDVTNQLGQTQTITLRK